MSVSAKLVACIRLAISLALVAGCFFASGSCAHAQVVPGTPPNLKLRARNSAVVTDLREKNFAALEESLFTEFFNDYYLQLFARPDDHTATDRLPLNKLRIELRTRFFGGGKSGAPYNRLNELTFQMMKAIIAGDFPISVKYNAMLVIGDLNETEFDAAVNARLRPWPKALDFMVKALKSNKVEDYLRVPALIGIMRHAELHPKEPMPADLRPLVTKTLTELLAQQTPPNTREPSAQAYLRCLAAQALGSMGESGAEGGNEVLSLLATTFKDPKNPLSVRCAAAQAFGEMKLPNTDMTGLVCDMLALAVTACETELARAVQEETEPNRRRLATCIASIRVGIFGPDFKHGLFPGVAEEKKSDMGNKIRTHMGAIIKLIDKGPIKPAELKVPVDGLKEIIKTYGKAPPIAPKAGGGAAARAALEPAGPGRPFLKAD